MQRQISKTDQFKELEKRLAVSHPRFTEGMEGVYFALAREPEESGIRNPDLDVWQARLVSPIAGVIYYTFTDHSLKILTIVPDENLN